MIVCLALLGDCASPGARERMCSGFPYWKRPMLSTYGIDVAGPARLGAFSTQTVPRGPSPLSWAAECSVVLGVWQPVLWTLWTLLLELWFVLPPQHSTERSSSFLSPSTKMSPCMFLTFRTSGLLPAAGEQGAWCGAALAHPSPALSAVPDEQLSPCTLLKEAG